MVDRNYYKRIAASKALLDVQLEGLAEANPGLSADEFMELAQERYNCPVTQEYAETLVATHSSGMKR